MNNVTLFNILHYKYFYFGSRLLFFSTFILFVVGVTVIYILRQVLIVRLLILIFDQWKRSWMDARRYHKSLCFEVAIRRDQFVDTVLIQSKFR